MKPSHVLALALIAFLVSGCGSASSTTTRSFSGRLSEDEKHRLYSAALAASDSPLDTESFKDVCRKIGILDADGRPTDQYMAFVSRHIAWSTNPETQAFRQEINSKDKATEYIRKHLSQ